MLRAAIVEDQAEIREGLIALLEESARFRCLGAWGSMEEALAALEAPAAALPDVLLVDLGLPGMSGYEVASEIKKIRPDLPVGLVTGWGATLDAEKARDHGVDLVISKPFRFDQVLGLVQEALEAKRAR